MGLRSRDAHSTYGPHKTLYNGGGAGERQACSRESLGAGCGGRQAEDSHDRCNLPEGASHGIDPAGKWDPGRLICRTKGGINIKLQTLAEANGRTLSFFMITGQVSDHTGAATLLDGLPKAQWLLGDMATTPPGSGTHSRPRASSPAF